MKIQWLERGWRSLPKAKKCFQKSLIISLPLGTLRTLNMFFLSELNPARGTHGKQRLVTSAMPLMISTFIRSRTLGPRIIFGRVFKSFKPPCPFVVRAIPISAAGRLDLKVIAFVLLERISSLGDLCFHLTEEEDRKSHVILQCFYKHGCLGIQRCESGLHKQTTAKN